MPGIKPELDICKAKVLLDYIITIVYSAMWLHGRREHFSCLFKPQCIYQYICSFNSVSAEFNEQISLMHCLNQEYNRKKCVCPPCLSLIN